MKAKNQRKKPCTHLDQIRDVVPRSKGCEECLKSGDSWVHLRLCLTCGFVGCCDDSRNKHATKHFHKTNHPIIKSLEPGENWIWCYIDDVALEQPPPTAEVSASWSGAGWIDSSAGQAHAPGGGRMAKTDPIQDLSDLTRKRFIELATELKPKTRQALKSLIDGLITQVAALRDTVAEMQRRLDHHSHGTHDKKKK